LHGNTKLKNLHDQDTATGILGAGVLLLATASAAEGSMLLTVEQVGADVVITGSG
jgi:hypothetical protein